MKKVFSGVRPTGDIHIGNYLGAIKNWVALQDKYECIYSIVDWHAITTPYDPKKIQNHIYELALTYLVSGIDPKKSIFFVQSKVKEHTELAWLLGTVLPLGELQRMTQYKEKSDELKAKSSAGLLNYPILMAADILLYQAELVPVGEDQVQHVELAKDIARRFNNKFGNTFKLPRAQTPEFQARIRSLQDPSKKMSKSGNVKGCIGLFDSPNKIKKKIMSAVTDTEREIKYNTKKKPGISNLLTIYSSFSNKSIKNLEREFQNKSYAEFKKDLANLLIEKLEPFRKAKKEIDKKEIQSILNKGAQKAAKMAKPTILQVSKSMGL